MHNLISIKETCRRTTWSRTTLWQKVRDGHFPKPVSFPDSIRKARPGRIMIVGVSVRGMTELFREPRPAIEDAAAWFAYGRRSFYLPIGPALRNSVR